MRTSRHLRFILWLSLMLYSFPAWAAEAQPKAPESAPAPTICPICRHANNQSAPYGEQAAGSLARGLTNTLFGWTEMIIRPTAEVERHGNLLNGIGQGVSYSARRTAAGIGEALTFWMPKSAGGRPPLVTDCPICLSARNRTTAQKKEE